MARQGDPEGTAGDPGERRDRGRREIGPRRRPEGVSGAALRCGARGGSGESPRGRRARKAAGGRARSCREPVGTAGPATCSPVCVRAVARPARGSAVGGRLRGRMWQAGAGEARRQEGGGRCGVREAGRRCGEEPAAAPAGRCRSRAAGPLLGGDAASLLFPSLPPRREAPGVAALTLARPPPAARRGAARVPRPGFPPLRLAWPRGGGAVAGRSRRSPALPAAAVAGSLPAGRGRGRPRGELGERSARGIARAAERAPITLCSHAPAPGRASVGAGQWAPARCGAGSQ